MTQFINTAKTLLMAMEKLNEMKFQIKEEVCKIWKLFLYHSMDKVSACVSAYMTS